MNLDDDIAATTGRQPELFEPLHESLQRNRLRNPPEAIYLDEWRKRNVRSPGVNGGYTTLEWILTPTHDGDPGVGPPPVSRRDAVVAACFAQWLGTSVGLGFMITAERRITEEESRREMVSRWMRRISFEPRTPTYEEQAAELADIALTLGAGEFRALLASALSLAARTAVEEATAPPRPTAAAPDPRGIIIREEP